MKELTPLASLRQRLADRTDSEHGQAIVRLVIVSIVAVYFTSDFFAANVEDIVRLRLARLLIQLSLLVSVSIFIFILLIIL